MLEGTELYTKIEECDEESKGKSVCAVVKPTVPYGCKAWILNAREADAPEIWDRKAMRKIYEGTI